MASENENTTTVTTEDGILDLRPPKGSLVRQLLRLGLTFDHKDASGETVVRLHAWAERDVRRSSSHGRDLG